jgi:hypothetical protein
MCYLGWRIECKNVLKFENDNFRVLQDVRTTLEMSLGV